MHIPGGGGVRTLIVHIEDAHAQALAELAKKKISDMINARDEVIQKIAEWERICSALAGTAAPEPQAPLPPTPSEDPAQPAALVADPTPAKPAPDKVSLKATMGRFPYKNAQYYLIKKTILWIYGDVVVIGREGYGDKRVRLPLALLQSLDEKKISSYANENMRAILRGLLREVDLSTMPPKEKEAPPLNEKKDTPPDVDISTFDPAKVTRDMVKPLEKPEKSKPEFFQEDTGFDYMSVQPKQVGKAQVYQNANGKMVIKFSREIVLTTKDMIEKLLRYDEKDLTASIRGISSQKQNILRVYIMEIKKRG